MTDQKQIDYLERVGKMWEEVGLTFIGGKILGYLLICGKPSVSFQELVDELGVSKASVSNNIKALTGIRFIKMTKPEGSRKSYYKPNNINMADLMQERTALFDLYADVMDEGLNQLSDHDSDAAKFMTETRDFYRWMKSKMPQLLDEYRSSKNQ